MNLYYFTSNFYNCLDTLRYEEIHEMFHEHSLWKRKGENIQGKVNIINTLKSRSKDVFTIHSLSNFCATELDTGIYETEYLLNVYEYEEGGKSKSICLRRGKDLVENKNGRFIFKQKDSKLICWK